MSDKIETYNFRGVPQVQTGMTNRWLKDQGLLYVKELWVNIYPPPADSLPNYGPVI